jgi:purine-nucleoside phosphorylase
MGIYSHELFTFYNVENIIRVGSAGGMQEGLKLRDLVIGMGACTNSNFASQYDLPGTFAPISSDKLLRTCVDKAEFFGLNYHVGNLLSSDTFYNELDMKRAKGESSPWHKMGVLAVEMEAAALYMTASRLGKNALAICTISDHLLTGEETTSEERQKTFTDMITLALEVAIDL